MRGHLHTQLGPATSRLPADPLYLLSRLPPSTVVLFYQLTCDSLIRVFSYGARRPSPSCFRQRAGLLKE